MKRIKIISICILIVITCLSCYFLQYIISPMNDKSQPNDSLSLNKNLDIKNSLITKEHQIADKIQHQIDSVTSLTKFKSDKYNTLKTNSAIASDIFVFQTGDTLDIASEGLLSEHLLGFDYTPKGLETSLGVKYKIEKQIYDDQENDVIADKITYKKSIIVIYNNPERGYDIAYANIVDKDLLLLDGIRIGMPKEECLDKVFGNEINYDYSEIKVFVNGDLFGNRSEYFIFQDDLLKQIIIKTSYDWITPD